MTMFRRVTRLLIHMTSRWRY